MYHIEVGFVNSRRSLGCTPDVQGLYYVGWISNTLSKWDGKITTVINHTDKAFEWLEHAYKQRDSGMPDMKGDPLLVGLQRDPRYPAFLKKCASRSTDATNVLVDRLLS